MMGEGITFPINSFTALFDTAGHPDVINIKLNKNHLGQLCENKITAKHIPSKSPLSLDQGNYQQTPRNRYI